MVAETSHDLQGNRTIKSKIHLTFSHLISNEKRINLKYRQKLSICNVDLSHLDIGTVLKSFRVTKNFSRK